MKAQLLTADNIPEYTTQNIEEKDQKKVLNIIEDIWNIVDNSVTNKHVNYICLCVHNSALSLGYQATEAFIKDITSKIREKYNSFSDEDSKHVTAIDRFLRKRNPDHPEYMVFRLIIIPDQIEYDQMGVYDIDMA